MSEAQAQIFPAQRADQVAFFGRGDNVDMGLAQINSKNLPALGLTVEQVFDPCTNIAAGANILAAGYARTGSLGGALSMYNTGRSDSTIGAAYAQKVFGQAGVQVPAIPGGQLAKLPKLQEASSFAANPAAMAAVQLTVRPSPFVAGLSPVRMAFISPLLSRRRRPSFPARCRAARWWGR